MRREDADKLWNDTSNWWKGSLYWCRSDPRWIVPKRNRWTGWTFNFAHPGAWAMLIIIIVLVACPALSICHSCPTVGSKLIGLAALVAAVIVYTVVAIQVQDRIVFKDDRQQ